MPLRPPPLKDSVCCATGRAKAAKAATESPGCHGPRKKPKQKFQLLQRLLQLQQSRQKCGQKRQRRGQQAESREGDRHRQ
mmetsp:Transcript_110702/g.277221  ORF Transcript_110702/g.277221 Transcript_110702/m.277221 type:complete len:80 (-) Transcript_110702:230-469(-)